MPQTLYFSLFESGLDLSLELYPRLSPDAIANTPGGDAVTQPEPIGAPYYYQASVDVPAGSYVAAILLGSRVVSGGVVRIADSDGSYEIVPPGETTAYPLEILDLIGALPAQLAAQGMMIMQPTLLGRSLSVPLVQGDSYLYNAEASQSRSIDFSRADFPDIEAGSTATLTARLECDSSVTFQISGAEATIPVMTGTKVVRFQPTSEQTASWQPGKYEFDVEIAFPDGNRATFVGPAVFLRVLRGVTE